MFSHVRPFRFWVQKVLPLVYDDSLSYYELLSKVVFYINNIIKDVSSLSVEVEELKKTLDDFLNSDTFKDAIEDKLDEMASDGTLDNLIDEAIGFSWYNPIVSYELDNTGASDNSEKFETITGNIGLREGEYLVSKNTTINCELGFARGAVIKHGTTTLTINGQITAGRYQIFDGTGDVILNECSVVYPEWFGAKNDGATDSTDGMKKAISAIRSGFLSLAGGTQGAIVNGNGSPSSHSYLISEPITWDKSFCRLGCADGWAYIACTSNSALIIGSANRKEKIEVDHIAIQICNETTELDRTISSNYAVRFVGFTGSCISDMRVLGNPLGYYFTNCTGSRFERLLYTPATTDKWTSDIYAYYVDSEQHNDSLHLNLNGGGRGTTGESVFIYVKGSNTRDLYFNRCEGNNFHTGVRITTEQNGHGNDIIFNELILDQMWTNYMEIEYGASFSNVRVVDSYMQRNTHATGSGIIKTGVGNLLLQNVEFLDQYALTEPTIEFTGGPVTVNNCVFRRCGKVLKAAGFCDFGSNYVNNTDPTDIGEIIDILSGYGTIHDNIIASSSAIANPVAIKAQSPAYYSCTMNYFEGAFSAYIDGVVGFHTIVNRQTDEINKIVGIS